MNYFSTLPEALFDSILQFSDVKDIVNFSNTSTEHMDFIEKITENSNTQVSIVYEMTDITDIETWVFLPADKFQMKFAKQYYDIYKNLGADFELEYREVKNIFYSMVQLVKEIYHLEEEEEKTERYEYVVKTLFEFIHTNNHIFDGCYTDISYNSRAKILTTLFRLYKQEFVFVDIMELEATLVNMFQDFINRLDNIEPIERLDQFIVEFLEGWFFTASNDTGSLGYITEMIEDMVLEADMGALFFIPEEAVEEAWDNDTIIDIDNLY